MSIGAGCYALCTFDQARATGARHYLCMLNHQLAAALRQADPWALIGLRPDVGRDGEQIDCNLAPESEARRWADVIRGRVAEAGEGTYNYTTGINEPLGRPLDWLARFEVCVCRHVQYGEGMPSTWRQLPYACLSGQVGRPEPQDVALFRDVLSICWGVNFHAYLQHYRTDVDTTDLYYAFRPLNVLMPEIVKINPRIALLIGECGTYYPPAQTGISKGDEARVQVEIAAAYERECQARGYNYIGAVSYGIGLDGDQREPWDLSGEAATFAEANAGAEAPPVVPTPLPETQPAGGEEVSQEEFGRWAADVYRRANVPFNPESGFVRYWMDSARRGRYLGRPEGPEHPTEDGRHIIQEYASCVLCYHTDTGAVSEGIPFA